MNDKTKSTKFRTVAFTVAVLFVFSLFIADLFRIQIANADEATVERVALKQTDTTIKAARGEILDCNGQPLVTNKQINSVIFNGSYFPRTDEQEQRNEIIISLIHLLESYGTEWNNDIPLYFDQNGNVQFMADRDADIKYLKSKNVLYLNEYARKTASTS